MLRGNSSNQNYKKAFSLLELSIVIVVVAVLIASITQGQKLLNSAKLANAQALTASSPVAATDGLILWLETTVSGSIQSVTNGFKPEDGDEINLWKDRNNQMFLKFDFSQSVSGTFPKYVRYGINSLPSAEFDGIDDLLETSGEDSLTAFDDMTIFVVFSVFSGISNDGNVALFSKGTGGGATNPSYAIQINGSSRSVQFFVVNSSDSRFGTSGYSAIFNKPAIFSAIHNSMLTNGFTSFANGVLLGTAASTTSIAINNSNVVIGRQKSNVARFFKGYINEIIFFKRALEDEERIKIEQYLSKKWNISK